MSIVTVRSAFRHRMASKMNRIRSTRPNRSCPSIFVGDAGDGNAGRSMTFSSIKVCSPTQAKIGQVTIFQRTPGKTIFDHKVQGNSRIVTMRTNCRRSKDFQPFVKPFTLALWLMTTTQTAQTTSQRIGQNGELG